MLQFLRTFYACLFFLLIIPANAQQPSKPNASEIYESIKKLNFLGSVLYIAAHPDDENTRLISHLSNETKARTAYLSVTRGDGGQNLIGPEMGELLGVIRTYELAEARKVDGGEQFFTRAVDFGFSKNPEETFSIWGKNEVLNDVVLAIRKFKPDVIINRFNHRTPGTTHGHHTAAAILGMEAFDLAGSDTAFPEQLQLVKSWQPSRLFFNTSWWFYGSEESFEKADKSNFITLKTGAFYPTLGLSNGEIAGLSRSKHQSQGFGMTGTRGEETEYLELLKGDLPKEPGNLFGGIDTTWSRLENGEPIGKILYRVEKEFDFTNPAASLPLLMEAYHLLKDRKDHWSLQKTTEIIEIIAACSGLFLEAVAEEQSTTRGAKVSLSIEAINRSTAAMELTAIKFRDQKLLSENTKLVSNQSLKIETAVNIPKNAAYTSPYWLKEKGEIGLFEVNDKQLIGLPFLDQEFPVDFTFDIAGKEITFTRNITYKYNSPITGEMYRPFRVLPDVTGKISEKVFVFKDASEAQIPVTIKAGRDNVSGTVTLQHPDGWKVSAPQTFALSTKGEEGDMQFTITPPQKPSEGNLKLLIQSGDSYFTEDLVTIDYDHIPFQEILLPAESRVVRMDIKKKGDHIGYIQGAGDAVPQALLQMGYRVTELLPVEISARSLKKFDAVVMGIRAYNIHEDLAFKQPELMEYVQNGGNLIVQYNVSKGLVTQNIAPYDLQLSRDRVTEEDAAVAFVQGNKEVLQTPNLITGSDFDNWVQERGLYFPESWAPEFSPVLRMNDSGETPKTGSLLVAKYGKGNYVYTGLSFFRQLPAGVPGAYRLFANLLSLSKNQSD